MLMPSDILNDKITRRRWNILKFRNVIWIIQISIDKENYVHIHDIKKLKKLWNILVDIYSNSCNMRYHKYNYIKSGFWFQIFSKI